MLSECRPKLEADPFLLSLFLCSAAISITMTVEVMMMTIEEDENVSKEGNVGRFLNLGQSKNPVQHPH